MLLSDSKQMRDADNVAIHVMGIPSLWLMKNAGEKVAKAALPYMSKNPRAIIFCGTGNNGGDGIAAAIYLRRRGYQVLPILIGDPKKMTEDTEEMVRRFLEEGGTLLEFSEDTTASSLELTQYGVIIDAIFGIGLHSPLRPLHRQAVEMMNASGIPIISADISTGIAADTGAVLGCAVKSTKTVTFSLAKLGHFLEPGVTYRGTLEVCDIGIPKDMIQKINTNTYALTPEHLSLPDRNPISHKSTYGKLLLIGGSISYTGAISLCARSAVRAGAGLVSVGVPQSIYEITAVKNEEAMPFPLPDDTNGILHANAENIILNAMQKNDVCVLGPGLGRSEGLSRMLLSLIATAPIPLVLDADALFALADDLTVLKKAKGPVILTPHAGEMKRLGGIQTGDRLVDARRFAETHGCILVLKGHRTICAFPNGACYIIDAGNPGMAKGGSGDVLAGIIGAMLAQFPVETAVKQAVLLHAYTGDLCAAKLGTYAMTPSDIIQMLPEATRNATKQERTTS